MTATAGPPAAAVQAVPPLDDASVDALARRWREEPPSSDELHRVLEEIGALPWPEGRVPGLVALARAADGPALVEALDRPGPARLGAVRLVTLIR